MKIAYGSIALLLIVVITLSFLLSNKSDFYSKNVCTTKACIKAANMILQNMDTTVDPCIIIIIMSHNYLLLIKNKIKKVNNFTNLLVVHMLKIKECLMINLKLIFLTI